MSSSLRRSLIQAAWLTGSLLAVYGAYVGITAVVSIDALAPFRVRPLPAGVDAGVTLSDVELVVYDGGRRAASAKADSLTLFRDRSRMVLASIRDGVVYPPKSKPLRFTAGQASCGLYLRSLDLSQGVRVAGPDFRVQAQQASWDDRTSIFTIPGALSGELAGGRIEGRRFIHNLRTGAGSMSPVLWTGMLQDPAKPAQKKRWEFRGDVEYSGDIRVYTNGSATDGEIIVKAPRLEHNARTDVLVATGGVRFWGKEANLAAPKVTVYRKEDRAVAEGGVFLYVKADKDKGLKEEPLAPIPLISPDKVADGPPTGASSVEPKEQKKLDEEVRSTKNLRQFPVAVRSEEMTYWYKEGSRRALIKGSPQARQELDQNRWRMAWSHEAEYDGEGDWLTLKSRPSQKDCRVRISTGDDVRATDAVISTKENDDRMKAKNAEGLTYYEDEDDSSGAAKPPAAPPGAKPPGAKPAAVHRTAFRLSRLDRSASYRPRTVSGRAASPSA